MKPRRRLAARRRTRREDALTQPAETPMNPPLITSTPIDRREPQPQDDAFLSQFDDEALERALKTVSCNPKDVRQFLRAAAYR
jgi:hypothetical protein